MSLKFRSKSLSLTMFTLAGAGIAILGMEACTDQTVDQPPPVVQGDGGTVDSGNGNGDDDDASPGTGTDAGHTGDDDDSGPVKTGDGGVDAGPPKVAPLPLNRCVTTTAGKSGGGMMLKGTVLAPTKIITNGEVLIDSTGVIQCVGGGTDCDSITGASDAAIVTCANGVISPGLINPHDHITYSNDPPIDHGTIRYESRQDWRTGDHGATSLSPQAKGGASAAIVLAAELRFLFSGATSTVGSGGTAGLLRNLDKPTLLQGLTTQAVDFDTFPLDDTSGVQSQSDCTVYSTSREYTDEMQNDSSYEPHIGEGIDLEAHNEVTCQSSGIHDLLQPQTAIIHSVAANTTDATNYKAAGTSVIWSPRSNISLYGNTAPVTMLDTMGVKISLGTDWLPSGSMNESRELACADMLNKNYFASHFSDFQLWEMVTTNAAFAAGVQKQTGLLAPGLTADIAVFDGSQSTGYRAVIEATAEDVVFVMRGGQILYGDEDILNQTAFGGTACEELTVCNGKRKACVAADTSSAQTLAGLITAGTAVYPMFQCINDTLPKEPTCVPYRNQSGDDVHNYSAGITTTDKDGDGIADTKDNCPAVFNPIRLMDGTAQADVDGDGIGDACDPCPTAKGTCSAPSADDIDGDTIANAVDNCPNTANKTQTDTDGDGYGDACESMSTTALVHQQGTGTKPAMYDIVELKGLVVTAIDKTSGNVGFYVQDPAATTYGGLFVETDPTVTVVIGDVVTIKARYVGVPAVTTVHLLSLTITNAAGTVPTPTKVTGATIATAATFLPYESMLVELDSVVVTNMNPDAPNDYDEFEVTGSCRIDDELYTALDNTYAVGTTFTKIVGIAGDSHSETKVWPRAATDIVTP